MEPMCNMKQRITVSALVLTVTVLATFGQVFAGDGWKGIEQRYVVAHDKGSLKGLNELVCWDGVPESVRGSVERSFSSDLQRVVSRVTHKPIAEDDITEYEHGGIHYRPNLEPVGWLVISFEPVEDARTRGYPNSTSYMVGIKDGTYMITTAVPVQ